MSHPYAEYLREAESAARRRRPLLKLLIPAGAAMAVSAAIWAHFAAFDVVAQAEGKVIPLTQVDVVQAHDGGVLREILVGQGDHVDQGQVVARLDDGVLKAEADSQRARRLVLAAAAARLDAEAGGGALHMPADVTAQAPDADKRETALFNIRRAELESNVQILGRQLAQRQSELAVLQGRERTVARSLRFVDQEMGMARELAAHGLKSRSELLKLDRQLSDIQGEADTISHRLVAAEAAVDEAQRRVDERHQAFQSQALQDLSKTRADMAAIDATLVTLANRVAMHEVRAPREGLVKRIDVADAGGLVAPGTPILDLMPAAKDTLLIEGKGQSAALGLLRPGQTASVRLDAPGALSGTLPVTVEQVSFNERDGEPSFMVRLHTAAPPAAASPIEPGMAARINISTGKQSVVDYFFDRFRQAHLQMALADQ